MYNQYYGGDMWYVYALENRDKNFLYIGHSNDLKWV
ncbi:MAG TPA: hypothetical protein ENH49_01545 [Candidatus Marinimicrobia bacterium]|nr:hypothetical protein [Candidatus Neomarinimicrobiota bacterium]